MEELQVYSQEAEKALIGSVLLNQEMYQEASKHVVTADFYNIKHKDIWDTFEALYHERTPIDILTVCDKLGEKLSGVGGQCYLLDLVNSVPTSVNAEYYAKIVRDKARRREAIQIASRLANFATGDNDLDAHIPKVMAEIMGLSSVEGKTSRVADALGNLFDDISERMANPQSIFGIPTGITKFDEVTGGLQRGEAFLLSGEPGLGKSLLSIQIAFAMAKKGFPGVVYEMEMSKEQTLRRTLSNESGVPVRNMKTGYLNDQQFQNIVDAIASIEKLPLYFSDSTSWTTAAMRADLTRLKQLHGVQWFVVDYLRLLKDRNGKDEAERLAHVGLALHDICKDLKLAGLIIHSMNKGGYEGTPGMENLSGSAQVSFDMDTIAFLTKDTSRQNRDKNIVNLTFDKQREGDASRIIQLVRKQGFPYFGELISEPYEPRNYTDV